MCRCRVKSFARSNLCRSHSDMSRRRGLLTSLRAQKPPSLVCATDGIVVVYCLICFNCPSATMVSTVAGFVFTMIALVANGSFAVFVKVPRVASIGTDSATFMLFMSVGIVITSLLSILLYPVLPESPPHVIITGWGILAGAIFVCSVTFSFLGIDYVGLAVAQGK